MTRISLMNPAGQLTGDELIEVVRLGSGPSGTNQNLRAAISDLVTAGKSAYDVAVDNGYTGTAEEWLASLHGKSAFEIAVSLGFTGTEAEWLATLKGDTGDQGLQGEQGLSAYQVAVAAGFTGDETTWLASLKGDQGDAGVDGIQGVDGLSAYQVAVNNGYTGTEIEWVSTLKGETGDQGETGLSAFDIAISQGFTGTLEEWVLSLKGDKGDQGDVGPQGLSAYEVVVGQGYSGTLEEWIQTLKGDKGDQGEPGVNGADGVDGKSAYQIAVDSGFVGTEAEWLESLSVVVDAGAAKVARKITVSNNGVDGFVNIVAEGTQDQLNQVVVTAAGETVEVTNVPEGLILISITISHYDGFNNGTAFYIKYPEPFGNTNIMDMPIPVLHVFNHSSPSVMQATTLQNYNVDSNGVVTVMKTGLIAGRAYRWRLSVI